MVPVHVHQTFEARKNRAVAFPSADDPQHADQPQYGCETPEARDNRATPCKESPSCAVGRGESGSMQQR